MTPAESTRSALVRFWGTRGTLPVAATAKQVRDKIANALVAAKGRSFANFEQAASFVDCELDFPSGATYGGATSCVEVDCSDDAFFICDMGSGLQELGLDASSRCLSGRRAKYNFFLSHMHWDHIMGFPAFLPARDPNSEIVIYACHPDAEEALRRQQDELSFPSGFDLWAAKISFAILQPGVDIEVDGLLVTALSQRHPHGSSGYRFTTADGRAIVYSTDAEHELDDLEGEAAFIKFFLGADLVICDTMYSLAKSDSIKNDWGHSSNVVAIDLCHQARAKRLVLFHHDPLHDDEQIHRMFEDSVRYEKLTRDGAPLEVRCAYDGLEITLQAG